MIQISTTQWTYSRQDLLRAGFTDRKLAEAVVTGALIRGRNGRYVRAGAPENVAVATRVGGVAGCVSAARLHGLWTVKPRKTHVWLRRGASRLRAPGANRQRLNTHNRDGCALHWRPLIDPDAATPDCVGVIDALAQMIFCVPLPFAIATIDSALNKRLVTLSELSNMFARLPARFAGLLGIVDGRCESGIETLVRLMMLGVELQFVPQVAVEGVGRVDFVVEGCVVVEVDGHEWHDDPNAQARDYSRDARLAALGYTVLRFDYQQVMFQPDLVLAAIRAAVRNHRNGLSM